MSTGGIHIFWLISRAAGITAMVLAGFSVAAGLMVKRRVRGLRKPEIRPLHEALSLATLAMVAIHGLALLGDPWLDPGLSGVVVPFATDYRAFWTGLGIIGAYGLAILGLTFYVRARIGVDRWRRLHRFVALFWMLAIVHSIGAGTDGTKPWYLAILALTSGPPLVLLGLRHLPRRERAPSVPGVPLELSNPPLSRG